MPKNNLVLDGILAPLASLLLILATHYGLFLGHTFLTGEVPFILFNYNVGNLQSSGWRPDLGLGVSWILGDPGTFHPWSLFRWWHELFSNPLTGFNASIFIFLWTACVAQYFLLRKALPELNRFIVYALSCMIAFGSLRYAYFFSQSYWGLFPVIVPVISLLLFAFQEKPSPKHYFLYALTLTLSLLLGSSITLLLTIFFSLAFFSVQLLYDRHNLDLGEFLVRIRGFFFLNIFACISIFALGAWTFYGILIESLLQDYTRDPIYGTSSFIVTPNLQFLFKRLLEYVHAGLFSETTSVLGIKQVLEVSGINNISPLFPVFLLAILFFKSRNFWEFITKFLILGTIIFQELTAWVPALVKIFQELLKLRPPTHFHPVLHVYGTLWLGIILNRTLAEQKIFSNDKLIAPRVLSTLLSVAYAGLFLVSILSLVAPEFLNSILLKSWNAVSATTFSQSLKALIPKLISESVNLFHETLGWSSVLFYGSTFAMLGLFATRDWDKIFSWKKGKGIAVVLLANSVLLSWTAYPLNKDPLLWDRQNTRQGKLFDNFAPTDRFMRVSIPSCLERPDPYPCIQNKFFNREFGPRRLVIGHMKTPGLELSGAKSFTQKQVVVFLDTLIKLENPELRFAAGFIRNLQLEPAIYSSQAYNISAVNYLLSPDPLPKSSRRELISSNHQFYLYNNLDAWPYFYLANSIETISDYEDLYEAEKGVAYLWERGPPITLQHRSLNSNGTIKLHRFEFDNVEYDYDSTEAEFLVIADAWHPNWRAKVNGIETNIVKTNGVFKGILLPPGKGRVHLYFDNTSYRPGIWISLVAWILFVGGWIVFSRRSRNQVAQDKSGLVN